GGVRRPGQTGRSGAGGLRCSHGVAWRSAVSNPNAARLGPSARATAAAHTSVGRVAGSPGRRDANGRAWIRRGVAGNGRGTFSGWGGGIQLVYSTRQRGRNPWPLLKELPLGPFP